MALKNAKNYQGYIARNKGIFDIDQIQIETRAAVPTDSNLANGRLVYITGTGFQMYNESAWVTIPTSTSGGSASSWETLYASDKKLQVTGATLTFEGANSATDTFTVTKLGGAGSALTITNAGTGDDITGPDFSLNGDGTLTVVELGTGATINATDGDLELSKASSTTTIQGILLVDETSTFTGAVVATASITVTGSADTDVLAVTDGDVLIDDGQLTITESDTATAALTITSAAVGGDVFSITADDLTSGSALYVDSAGEANFSGDGGYLNLTLSDTSVFKVQRYGATTIAGSAGSTMITVTAGDVLLGEGSVSMTDDDNAATLQVINDGATTIGAASSDSGIVDLEFDALTTGQGVYIEADAVTSGSILSIDNGGNTLTTGYYIECHDNGTAVFTVGDDGAIAVTSIVNDTVSLAITSVATAADVVTVATTALTTGDAMVISSTAETLAAGELLKITNTENGDLHTTPKTGNLASITSSVTATTASTALDYDTMLISRSNIMNAGTFTLTAAGSVLKLLNTSTDTAGTCTDTTIVLEIEQAEGGTAAPTGNVAKITSVGVAATALNIVSASTTVSDVLITGSGVKASDKAVLEVSGTGATAAGGSIFRVTNVGGTPAAATSYLAEFNYVGATTSSNPDLMYIAQEGTGRAIHITTSGAADPLVDFESTEAGTTGVVLRLSHQGGTQADNDVVGRIEWMGEDVSAADNDYAKIDVISTDSSDGTEDGDMLFYVCRAGTLKNQLSLDSDVNGILIGDGAATGIVSSKGEFDLELTTNSNDASDPTIVLTDDANGDITITPAGTGLTNIVGSAPTVTDKTSAATLTEAEGGVITVNTTSAAFACTLPAVSGNSGLWYTFKKTDAAANAMTITGSGEETIDGSNTNATIDAQYDTITIVTDGTSWHIISEDLA